MKIYWRLFSFARPIEKYAIPYFFCILFHVIFNTFNYALIIPILDTLFNGDQARIVITQLPEFHLSTQYYQDLVSFGVFKVFGENYSEKDVLMLLAAIVVTSAFFSNLFRYLSQRTIENLRIKTLQTLRNTVYDHVMDMHVSFFSNERKGDIISKITSDVTVVQFCITNTLQVVFREPFMIIGYMFMLISISWELTIFTALFLPITALIIGGIVKRLRHNARKAQENFGELSSILDESLGGVKIIKAYNATDYVKGKFHYINYTFSKISKSIANRQQLAAPTSEFLGITAVAVILIYGGNLVLAGNLPAAGFMAYIAIFSQITRPARALTDSFSTINQGIAAGERVLGLLDTENLIPDKPTAVDFNSFNSSIEFRDVHFAYEQKEVIKGVNIVVNKGETIALVGASGGGKSTLSDLIPRFYDVTQGAILVDGVDLRDYKKESLRSRMGMVAQDTILFNDTIENNIRLGNAEASLEDIERAAKVANAHCFIAEMDNGYQSNIGDRGMKLSGGQRQRLSIARAVLRNPDILILDEATSALDTESEVMVQQALENLLQGRTSIVIAHRLSTIRNANRIYVIDQGVVAEQGTHDQLMKKSGIYCKLIEMQQLS